MTADRRSAMHRRLRPLLAGAAAIFVTVAPAAHAATPPPAIPPDLQTLLSRSAQERIPYEIVQTSDVLNSGGGFTDTASTTEVRLSPPQFATSSGVGAQAMRLRLTGGLLYVEVPGLAGVAHGRRWLSGTPHQIGASA